MTHEYVHFIGWSEHGKKRCSSSFLARVTIECYSIWHQYTALTVPECKYSCPTSNIPKTPNELNRWQFWFWIKSRKPVITTHVQQYLNRLQLQPVLIRTDMYQESRRQRPLCEHRRAVRGYPLQTGCPCGDRAHQTEAWLEVRSTTKCEAWSVFFNRKTGVWSKGCNAKRTKEEVAWYWLIN